MTNRNMAAENYYSAVGQSSRDWSVSSYPFCESNGFRKEPK